MTSLTLSEAIAEYVPTVAGVERDPSRSVDLDAVGLRYLARAKKQAAIARWLDAVPYSMRRFDATRPEYATFLCVIREIFAREYQGSGLLLSGPSGAGKTRVMWQVMKAQAKLGRHARYWHASDFFAEMQAQVNYGRDDAGAWIKAMASVPVVFIDDFGQHALQHTRAAWCQDWFFRFLDLRASNQLPLFITTNMTAAEMAGRTSAIQAHPFLRRLLMVCKPIKLGV